MLILKFQDHETKVTRSVLPNKSSTRHRRDPASNHSVPSYRSMTVPDLSLVYHASIELDIAAMLLTLYHPESFWRISEAVFKEGSICLSQPRPSVSLDSILLILHWYCYIQVWNLIDESRHEIGWRRIQLTFDSDCRIGIRSMSCVWKSSGSSARSLASVPVLIFGHRHAETKVLCIVRKLSYKSKHSRRKSRFNPSEDDGVHKKSPKYQYRCSQLQEHIASHGK